ncbi:hypothetical protein [Companilactobacillus mishanensis]|uniref:hypothetical protein n=1 Tax=Companilactobacillus mishanensis TaxID=2486008 RepID=UPI0012963FD0|nr:hypothetical protein [Companilactobacillus mishanensis]MQS88293.1 hypothetical protein [Companilactobacillus mishanensis]
MNDTLKIIISAIGGAIVSGIFGVWGQKLKNTSSNESVYAEHTDIMWDRLDKITNERDELKEQVIKLNAKIDEQSKIIDQLTRQMSALNSKFQDWESEN